MNESAASNFINSLVRNLQVLCHSNVEFRNDIEVVGHLYLKVDRQKKFNYIVDEKVCKNDASSTMFVSNSYHSVNLAPKKKDGQANEGSNKTNTDSSDSGGASADPNRVNSKGENRSVPSSPHHQPSSSGEMYRTPVKRGMRSPEVPSRKQPRMSGDMSGGTGPQSFSFSLQRDRESPHKPDRSMSQDSSSSFKDTGGSSEAVEIDLTNIKEEVIDDKSAIQASCFFNQEQQQMLGQSSVPPFPKEPGSDDMGLYPVSLHANESPNIDNLSQLASNLASGSSQGNPFSQSPQQMPQFLSEDRFMLEYVHLGNLHARRKEFNPEGAVQSCHLCSYRTKRRWNLVRHIRLKHSGPNPMTYKCPVVDCFIETMSLDEFHNHIKIHEVDAK